MRLALRRVLIFGTVAVAIGLYYFLRHGSVGWALVAGLGCGTVVVILDVRFSSDREQARRRVLQRFPYFEALVGGVGILVVVGGAILGSAGLAVSGLPFVGLAAALLGVKAVLRRRQA